MNDSLLNFCDAIGAAGLEPPDEPGKIHRFPGIGKRPSNRAGRCLLFDNGLGGCYSDGSSGFTETWQSKRDKPDSQAERPAFARRMEAAKAQIETKRKTRQADAANRAVALWHSATPAPCNHPYLIQKGIPPHGARCPKGALTLPVMDCTGRLTSLQFIDADRAKRLLSGGHKQGCFIPIVHSPYSQNTHNSSQPGNSADIADSAYRPPKIVICKDWATGCTLAEADPSVRVLVAIDAGNLEPVAVAARRRWPSAKLLIAGQAAAITADDLLALTRWPEGVPESLTDFNELTTWLARGVR